jgi:hypothetical protein
MTSFRSCGTKTGLTATCRHLCTCASLLFALKSLSACSRACSKNISLHNAMPTLLTQVLRQWCHSHIIVVGGRGLYVPLKILTAELLHDGQSPITKLLFLAAAKTVARCDGCSRRGNVVCNCASYQCTSSRIASSTHAPWDSVLGLNTAVVLRWKLAHGARLAICKADMHYISVTQKAQMLHIATSDICMGQQTMIVVTATCHNLSLDTAAHWHCNQSPL